MGFSDRVCWPRRGPIVFRGISPSEIAGPGSARSRPSPSGKNDETTQHSRPARMNAIITTISNGPRALCAHILCSFAVYKSQPSAGCLRSSLMATTGAWSGPHRLSLSPVPDHASPEPESTVANVRLLQSAK